MKYIFIEYKDKVYKITLSLNKNALKKIKEQIVQNCSTIKKIRNQKVMFMLYNKDLYQNDDHYKNIKINIEKYPYTDCGYGDGDEEGIRYESYDYYEYPDIIKDINNILEGKYGGKLAFNINFSYKEQKTESDIDELIHKIINDPNIDSLDKTLKTKEIIEKYIQKNEKYNKYIKIKQYFQPILSCFIVNNIEVMNIEKYEEIISFLELKQNKLISYDTLDPEIKKYLNLEIPKVKTRTLFDKGK